MPVVMLCAPRAMLTSQLRLPSIAGGEQIAQQSGGWTVSDTDRQWLGKQTGEKEMEQAVAGMQHPPRAHSLSCCNAKLKPIQVIANVLNVSLQKMTAV